jgi:hypothetical protein
MRTQTILKSCLLALLCAACSYDTEIGEVEKTDLSDIDPGVKRTQIEEDLGSPVNGRRVEVGKLEVYAYDMGRSGEKLGISQGVRRVQSRGLRAFRDHGGKRVA